ncbi:MAG: hypothetical protein H6512_06610 [Acidimicrobiia bacterium]|nr:hypothetical protein [Acidimicrobiia bacterium]
MVVTGMQMSKTWFSREGRTRRRSDVVAGLTVGAMLVPQAMAYAQLGGLPPQVGLYAATLPLLVYMLIGTSRQLAVGPVALVSLLTATAIEPLADQDTATYLQLAAALALIVGAIYVVAGVFKLGSAVNLLSHAVLVGFTAGAALIIGVSQAKYVLGVPIPRGEFADNLADTWRAIPDANGATVLVAAVAILVMIAIKRWLPSVPSSLVVVIGSIAAVRLLHLADHGVAVVGDIPAGLPPLGVPSVGGSQVIDLLPSAVVIVIIGLMESFAVAKVYARRHRYDIDANREALGIGAANIAAGDHRCISGSRWICPDRGERLIGRSNAMGSAHSSAYRRRVDLLLDATVRITASSCPRCHHSGRCLQPHRRRRNPPYRLGETFRHHSDGDGLLRQSGVRYRSRHRCRCHRLDAGRLCKNVTASHCGFG